MDAQSTLQYCELLEKPAGFRLSDITFLDNPGISKFPTLTFILSHAVVANLPRSHATDTFAFSLIAKCDQAILKYGECPIGVEYVVRPHVHTDGVEIRKAAIAMNVPLLTTLSAAMAAVSAIQALGKKELKYRSLTESFWGRRVVIC